MTKELVRPFEEPKRVLHSTRKLFKTLSLDNSSSPKFDLFFDPGDQCEEEATEAMTKPTMEEYVTITRIYCGSRSAKLRIELKGRFLLELRDNAFNGTNGEDAVEHIENFLKIVNSLNVPNVTHGQFRISGKIETNGTNMKVKWDPTIVEFENWITDNDSNPRDDNLIEENEIAQIFRINMMYFTLRHLYTEPINNIHHPWKPLHFKKGAAKWSTCNWKEDGYCNTGDLPDLIREGNSNRYQDYEWYAIIEDSELKEEALNNKAILDELMKNDEESSNDAWSHYSPIDEWKDYEHTTYIETDA
ncbi:hypothetical protein Tco_0970312 [Tanacetum coccineum]